MTDKEAMKLAHDALGAYMAATDSDEDAKAHSLMAKAFFALKEVLEQTEQEPVAGEWVVLQESVEKLKELGWNDEAIHKANTPPQRTEPLFWYRPCSGGMYEGPVHNNSVGGKMLRDEKPDEWKPLYPTRTEQNFCPRCGKRTPDLTTIHTCTPPQENT